MENKNNICSNCGFEKSMNSCTSLSCGTCEAIDYFGTRCPYKHEVNRRGCQLYHRSKQKLKNAKYEEFSVMMNTKTKQDTKKYKDDVVEFNRKENEYQQRVENKINESNSEKEQDMIRVNPECFVNGT